MTILGKHVIMKETLIVIISGREESAAVMREEKQGLYKFITAILLINLLYYLSFHNIQDSKRDIF